MIIDGAISVKSAILNKSRIINTVYIDKDKTSSDVDFIIEKSKLLNIELKLVDRSQIDTLTLNKTHGGICADVEVRISNTLQKGDIFYIDGIEDPFNLGYMLRSLCAFGFNNVILKDFDRVSKDSQILKSSAGAYDKLNVAFIDDIEGYISSLKPKYKVYGLYRGKGSISLFQTNFKKNSLYIVGGEKRGINSKILSLCDHYIDIDYPTNFKNSLNASSALSMLVAIIYDRVKHDRITSK